MTLALCDTTEQGGLLEIVGAAHQTMGHRGGVGILVGFDQRLVVDHVDALTLLLGIAEVENGVFFVGKLQEGDLLAFDGVDVWDDGDFLLFIDGELLLNVEGADGVDLVAEEVDAEGLFVGVGEDVEDAAAKRVLSWLINELLLLEAIRLESLNQLGDAHLVANGEVHLGIVEASGGNDFLYQRIGKGDDDDRLRLLQTSEGIGTENLVGIVDGTVFVDVAVGGGEEGYLVAVEELREVVVAVGCVVFVLHHDDDVVGLLCMQQGDEERAGRPLYAVNEHVTFTVALPSTGFLDQRMLLIKLQKFQYLHRHYI